jgi:hypothetical protein
MNPSIVMPAKAGIQKAFEEILDSRLRGNDNQFKAIRTERILL